MSDKSAINYSISFFSFAIGMIAGYLQYGDLIHVLLGGAVVIVGNLPIVLISMIPVIGVIINVFFIIPLISSTTGFTHWMIIDYWIIESIIINIVSCIAIISAIVE